MNSRVEQLVARKAHNLEVAGSSPAPATTTSSADMAGLVSSLAGMVSAAKYSGEPEFHALSPSCVAANFPPLAAFFLCMRAEGAMARK